MLQQSNGLIIIDKPAGISSAKVVAIAKKTLHVKKIGHTGTLDPFATGILVCCLNKATRIADFLIRNHKKYEAVLHLGIETDTKDLTGKIIAACGQIDFSVKKIDSVFKKFIGETKQIPPVYSALKHKGVPLYKLARQGTPVIKPARTIIISDINILYINLPEIGFDVSCSSGTYIRTLASDIGKALGCGAHLKSLRRVQNGIFTLQDSVRLYEIEKLSLSEQNGNNILENRIISMTDALPNMPTLLANDMQAAKIINGGIITGHDFHYDYDAWGNTPAKIIDKTNNVIAIVNYNNKTDTYKYYAVFG